MAENKNRMNNEPVFGSLAYDLNTLNWEQLDGNAVPPAPGSPCAARSGISALSGSLAAVRRPAPGSTPPPFWWAAWPFWP